jgi:hypothetical protein
MESAPARTRTAARQYRQKSQRENSVASAEMVAWTGDRGLGSGDLGLIESHFKGWAKPGPIAPGAFRQPDVPPDESLDTLSGHFRIYQLRAGHRSSTDDLLTAWYGTTWAPSAATVLDLGSGIGSVSMIAAWRLRGARFVTIEAQEESVRLARKSAAYNGPEALRDSARRLPRRRSLRDDEKFDLVLASRRTLQPAPGSKGIRFTPNTLP